MRPRELHGAAAKLAVERGREAGIVEPDARGVERHDAVEILERVREREVTQASLRQHRLARDDRPRRGAADERRDVGAAGAADVAHEALQHGEVRGAVGLERQRLASRSTLPATSSAVSSPTSRSVSISQRLPVDGQLDRALIAQTIVDEPQVELLDRRRDAQGVAVVELAGHANRAAGRRRCVRREVGLEHAHVRIERRVAHPERQLGVGVVVERDAAGARHREARRRRFELVGQQLVAHRRAGR